MELPVNPLRIASLHTLSTTVMLIELDAVSPGWRDILQAYKNNTFIIFQRELAYPSSFTGLHYVLDEFEKYAR